MYGVLVCHSLEVEEQYQVVVSCFDFQTHGNDQAGRFILSLRKLFLKSEKPSNWMDTYNFLGSRMYGWEIMYMYSRADGVEFNELLHFNDLVSSLNS